MYGQATVEAPSTSPGLATTRYARWAGRVVSALVVAFLAFDGITKAMKLEPIVQATTQFGYLGGAAATQVRVAKIRGLRSSLHRGVGVGRALLEG